MTDDECARPAARRAAFVAGGSVFAGLGAWAAAGADWPWLAILLAATFSAQSWAIAWSAWIEWEGG